MKKKIPLQISLLWLLIALLTSCGGRQSEQVEDPEQTIAPTQTPAPPQTQEELRQAIGQLGSGEEALDFKRKYYEELLAMDVFEEADYVALAQVYGELGQQDLQREMLSKVLRLYPSREYAKQLSDIVVRADSSDSEMAAIAAQIMEALGQQDGLALRELTGQETWRVSLQGNMTGVMTRTHYQEGEDVLQIVADGGYTQIMWLGAGGRLCFYEADEAGSLWGETVLQDGGYTGAVTVAYSDGEGNLTRSCNGTLKEGVCVDQISITYQGTTYTGKLNADGTTAEEQYQKVTAAGGVVYAYTADKRAYLYQENAKPESFRMDATYLGIPEYEEWR